MHSQIDHRSLYRLPWTNSDNVIAWLEPTSKCNLACEGCYRANVDQHKSIEEVRQELDAFRRYRTFDAVSIAGGDPLLHPRIVDIVRMITADGHKAVLNTNGLALSAELLRDLKQAGLVGFTFHVDSHQGRPGWKDNNELELNALRLSLARQVAQVGGLSVSFNATVYEDTLQYVPDLVQFAQEHIDLIHVMVFILYRTALTEEGPFDFYAGGQKVDGKPLVYTEPHQRQRFDITSQELVTKIRERFPEFSPSAYLGGTERPDSLKWLYTGRIGTPEKILGYVGPKLMEAAQTIHHAATGKYLGYVAPWMLGVGQLTAMLASGVDPASRKIVSRYLGDLLANPLRMAKPVHYQSIMIIQPGDLLPDGRQNMCDGCPDMTVHQGELVWSCRLEEKLQYGCFVNTVPKRPAEA